HALPGAQHEVAPALARAWVLEAAHHSDRARAFEQHALHRRAGHDRAAACQHLGQEVAVQALLPVGLAAVQALAMAAAALHVARDEVVVVAEGVRALARELVGAAARGLRDFFGVQLALEFVLQLPDAIAEVAAHAGLALPAFEHVAGRAHGDRGVDHGRATDERALNDRPVRAPARDRRAPAVEHVAHRAVHGAR